MESTVSVSKGVFLFRNGYQRSKSHKKKVKCGLFETLFMKEPWYIICKKNWNLIEHQLKDLHQKTYSALLHNVVRYMKLFDWEHESDLFEGVIPSATLLTGINQPDHINQFISLIDIIRNEVTPHVALIVSQDAQTVKQLVESAVWQLIHGSNLYDSVEEDDECRLENQPKMKLKKGQCTMKVLQNWYNMKYAISPKKNKQTYIKKSLVVIMPDFESFNCNVLQDFVLIVSSYISSLPIIFVFGVATSVSALHKSFPYHVSSKLLIKVFHSHSSHIYMNEVLDNVFLTHTSLFHLSGKAFQLLTDVFLFYDFSVTGLIQGIKYCFMDHYYGDNSKILCCQRDEIEEKIINLSAEDLENIRQLSSFRPFLESQDCLMKIRLFENDNFFREVLLTQMKKLHEYIQSFYVCLRLLLVFVKDLPKNIFGKSIREMYAKCAAECITGTAEFKECMQLLNFQSQYKLAENLKDAVKVVNNSIQTSPVRPLRSTPIKNNHSNIAQENEHLGENFLKTVKVHLLTFLRQIEHANNETTVFTNIDMEDNQADIVSGNRYKLKEKLLKATRVDKIQSEFEMIRSRFVSYIEEMFSKGLQPPHTQPFHEILFFSDVANVKKHIIGSPRGAIHTALSNPVHYLQCSCCHLPSLDSVSDTVPDMCLAYKLHHECGKHINLYDWLQAFAAVLRPEDDDETRFEDPSLQVRFTRAVAELQFLGFIKSSKRKTDHVMRLTCYETGHGIGCTEIAEGLLYEEKKPHAVVLIRGSYTYTDNKGKVETVDFFANESLKKILSRRPPSGDKRLYNHYHFVMSTRLQDRAK